MARTFDGSDDLHIVDAGALSGMTHGTVACLLRTPSSVGGFIEFFVTHGSSGAGFMEIMIAPSGPNWSSYFDTGGGEATGPNVSTSTWYLMVFRKATGTATPRWSIYNFSTGAWTHANASQSLPNASAPGVGGTVETGFQDGALWAGDLAARAAWSNALPWSADSTGDAKLEAAGLQHSLAAWINADPDALWVFDQSATSQKVTDLTGGGANETAITGTSVSTNSVPGFGYGHEVLVPHGGTAGGGGITGTADVTLPALAADTSGAVTVAGTADAALPALAATADGAVTVGGTATATLPALAATADGTVTVSGTAGVTLPALAASADGSVAINGPADAVLPALDASLSGTVTSDAVLGAADVVLPALAASLDGGATVAGTASVTLPALAASLDGHVANPVDGTVDIVLPALSVTITGTLPAAATYSFTPPTTRDLAPQRGNGLELRLRWPVGVSVVRGEGDVFVDERWPHLDPDWVEGEDYFVGGHLYSGIPADIAAELISAGYAPVEE